MVRANNGSLTSCECCGGPGEPCCFGGTQTVVIPLIPDGLGGFTTDRDLTVSFSGQGMATGPFSGATRTVTGSASGQFTIPGSLFVRAPGNTVCFDAGEPSAALHVETDAMPALGASGSWSINAQNAFVPSGSTSPVSGSASGTFRLARARMGVYERSGFLEARFVDNEGSSLSTAEAGVLATWRILDIGGGPYVYVTVRGSWDASVRLSTQLSAFTPMWSRMGTIGTECWNTDDGSNVVDHASGSMSNSDVDGDGVASVSMTASIAVATAFPECPTPPPRPATTVFAECDLEPPVIPPVDPPVGDCCPWSWGADASLGASIDVVIRTFNAATGLFRKEWIIKLPATIIPASALQNACDQLRTSVLRDTVPGTQAYVRSATALGGAYGTNTAGNISFQLEVDLGDDASLPLGARVRLRAWESPSPGGSTLFTMQWSPAAGCELLPGSIVTQGFINQMSETGCSVYKPEPGAAFYTGAQNTWFTPGGEFVSGGVRWQIALHYGVNGYGWGACPEGPQPDDPVLTASGGRSRFDADCGCVRDVEGGVR